MIQRRPYYALFHSLLILFVSCSKDESPKEPEQITVETENVTFTIDENPFENQLIGTIPGSTNSGSLEFSMVEQSPTGAIIVDLGTGQLHVKNVSLFDYELYTSITGKVKVKNGTVSKTSTFQINIKDIVEGLFEGNAELNSQEELEEFGAHGYIEITGKLVITELDINGSPITDLSSLGTIEKIGGLINIVKCQDLISLKGLNNLKNVEGVYISVNDNLEDISALQQLEHSNALDISHNPKLVSINAFSNITSMEGKLKIASNDFLVDLVGLQNLTTIGELQISYNDNLESVQQLSALTTVNGNFDMYHLPKLVNLDGLGNLQSIMGHINISNIDNLMDINGLQNLNTLKGNLAIQGNETLDNIDALSKLTTVENIQIDNCDALQNLNGLSNLTAMSGYYIYISGNLTLNDFCGLSSLIDEDFSIDSYIVKDNLYNPTIEDMINNNCSN